MAPAALPDTRLKALASRYIEALNADDAETVIALFHPDATVEDPVGAPVRRGLGEIAPFYRAAFSRNLRAVVEIPPRGSYSDAAAYAFRVVLPDMTLEVIGVLTFDDADLITSMRAFYGPSDRIEHAPGAIA